MTDASARLLLGSGPSNVPPPVLEALARPTMGHMDPAFFEICERVQAQLRSVFATSNAATFALPATGGAGPAAFAANFTEPGDRVVVAVAGAFGERMAQAFERTGAEVERVTGEWGGDVEPDRLFEALDGAVALAVVHGETSTGAVQRMDGLGPACREVGALLLVDCVTSLSGMPVQIDDWQVDAAFSGTQKCLNCPPGLAPFTAGERAMERLAARSAPPSIWYLDLAMIGAWWDPARRAYHHTVPVNSVYALEAALELVLEEGLEPRFERHREAHQRLRSGLAELGFAVLADPGRALWPLTVAVPPDGIDEADIRAAVLASHNIEFAAGLGELAGRAFRVGLMGDAARSETADLAIEAIRAASAT